MSFNPRNILVIDFGQLGDVVLSLPALRAIREKFPQAHITVAIGAASTAVVELSGYSDATLVVDRVGLRDGSAPLSILRIVRLVKDVRRSQFDFVIDLHSLSETNLLGYLSGAHTRLYARRPGRSLDFLSSFHTRPPVEDRNKHAVDRYLQVLVPLGITNAPRVPRLPTRAEDDRAVEQMLRKEKADMGAPLVGIFPGAGHPERRWSLARFAELADMFVRNDGVRVVVFLGPEEHTLAPEIRRTFPPTTIVFDRLSIPQLASALARLAVFVANDTGPMHVAAAVGASTVVLLDRRAPRSYIPLGSNHRIIQGRTIDEMTADEVYGAARELLASGRTASLFTS
nr:glycosyltransferase family 9 (heptosyltransferase) [uncultured bacterium]